MFESLKRDPAELSIILSELNYSLTNENDRLSFDKFVQIMQKLEVEMDKSQTVDISHENEQISNVIDVNQPHSTESDKPKVLNEDIKTSPTPVRLTDKPEFEQDEPTLPKYEMVDEASESEKVEYGPLITDNSQSQIPITEGPIPGSNFEDMEKSNMSSNSNFIIPKSPTAKERKIYGAMLPKHGVYFLPDLKVMDFIRVLNNYRRECLRTGKLSEARQAKHKISELQDKEKIRQLTNMCISHEREVDTVKKAQTKQFIEFEKAWDSYMMEYEMTANKSIKKLKTQQQEELKALNSMLHNEVSFKVNFSQELISLKKRIKKLISVGKYEEADLLKYQADDLEKVNL